MDNSPEGELKDEITVVLSSFLSWKVASSEEKFSGIVRLRPTLSVRSSISPPEEAVIALWLCASIAAPPGHPVVSKVLSVLVAAFCEASLEATKKRKL